jgi:hypothetical protein
VLDSTPGRWLIGLIAAVGVIALLAWARNDPGVGGRQPDPPTSTVVIKVVPVPRPPSTDVESTVPPPTVDSAPTT